MQHYVPKYFKLHEMLPYNFYMLHQRLGAYLWTICFDWRILWTGDRLRERWGTTICNDYSWGGNHRERGLRTPDTTTGTVLSQHKFGRALDLKFKNISAHEAREQILGDPWGNDFKYITCVEVGLAVTWLHLDVRNWDKNNRGILQVKNE